jgi:hypothetical protein
MFRKLVWAATAAAVLLSTPAARAEDSSWDSFVDGIGKMVYFAAFPTATYRGARLDRIHRGDNGTEVIFIVDGISAFDDSDLWTEAIVTVRNLQVVDLRFGDSNAVLSAPGATMKNLGLVLADLSKQYQASHPTAAPAPPPQAPPPPPPLTFDPPAPTLSVVHMTWVLSNQCAYSPGLKARFFDVTRNFAWPADRGKIFTLAPLTTEKVAIDTYKGDTVCIGASYLYTEATYWGVGPSNDHNCPSCCFTADDGKVDWPITCN